MFHILLYIFLIRKIASEKSVLQFRHFFRSPYHNLTTKLNKKKIVCAHSYLLEVQLGRM